MSAGPLDRILREAGPGVMEALERLSPTDLQSLLMEVFRRRASSVSPARLLEENRFTAPSPCSPVTLLEFDRIAFDLAAQTGLEPIELAPLCPLGTTTAVTNLSQNNIVSTVRNTEAMADPTNAMALECAVRRKSSGDPVRLCCSQRVTRAQPVKGAKAWAHFRLFAMVSAGRDEGSYGFESAEIVRHISFYLRLFSSLPFSFGATRVLLTNFAGEPRAPAHEKIIGELSSAFPAVKVEAYPERETGRGYYDESCFQIHAIGPDGEEYFLADGGITDWTQQLLSNKKERLMISGLGSERLCSVFQIRASDD